MICIDMKTLQQIRNEDIARSQDFVKRLNAEVERDCYAEWVLWARKHGLAKTLRKQGIIDNKGRLLV